MRLLSRGGDASYKFWERLASDRKATVSPEGRPTACGQVQCASAPTQSVAQQCGLQAESRLFDSEDPSAGSGIGGPSTMRPGPLDINPVHQIDAPSTHWATPAEPQISSAVDQRITSYETRQSAIPAPDQDDAVHRMLAGFDKLVNDVVREIGRAEEALQRQMPEMIDRTLDWISTCTAVCAHTAKQASHLSRQAADAACRLNVKAVEDALAGMKIHFEELGVDRRYAGHSPADPTERPIAERRTYDMDPIEGNATDQDCVSSQYPIAHSLLDTPNTILTSPTLAPNLSATASPAASPDGSHPLSGSTAAGLPSRREQISRACAGVPERPDPPLMQDLRRTSISMTTEQMGQMDLRIHHCAMQLLEMGYGEITDRGIGQVYFFAEAADGAIDQAIDLLREQT